jgi:hypothetical protein
MVEKISAVTCSTSLRQAVSPASRIQREADLHCNLPVRNLIIFKVTAQFGDFKPLHISDRLAGSRDRVIHGAFNAVRRRTDELNFFIDVVTHNRIKPWRSASCEHNSERRSSVVRDSL